MGQKPLPCARENRKMTIELVLFQIYTKLFDAQKLMADIYILHLIRWHEIIHNHKRLSIHSVELNHTVKDTNVIDLEIVFKICMPNLMFSGFSFHFLIITNPF